MNELDAAKHRIDSLERLLCEAYDVSGQRGKGACAHIRRLLAHVAEPIKDRWAEERRLQSSRTAATEKR